MLPADALAAPPALPVERTRFCERCEVAHPESNFPRGTGTNGLRRFCYASERPRGRTKGQGRRRVKIGAHAPADGACDACHVVPAQRAGGCREASMRNEAGVFVAVSLCPTCRSVAVAALGNVARLRMLTECLARAYAVNAPDPLAD